MIHITSLMNHTAANNFTLGMKIRARKIVVRTNIPATYIPVPMLMYVLRENVTRANTTSTMLDMYMIVATYVESRNPWTFTFLV